MANVVAEGVVVITADSTKLTAQLRQLEASVPRAAARMEKKLAEAVGGVGASKAGKAALKATEAAMLATVVRVTAATAAITVAGWAGTLKVVKYAWGSTWSDMRRDAVRALRDIAAAARRYTMEAVTAVRSRFGGAWSAVVGRMRSVWGRSWADMRGDATRAAVAATAAVKASWGRAWKALRTDGKKTVTSVANNLMGMARTAVKAGADAAKGLASFLSSSKAMKALSGGIDGIIDGLLSLVPLQAAVVAGSILLAPALYAVGGAAGAATTAGVGLAGVFATVTLGTHGLSDALTELADTGKLSDATLKSLSPSAVRLTYAINGLRKPFGVLRKAIQESLLSGLDKTLGSLARTWLPVLPGMLGAVGGALNRIVKSAAAALGSKGFVGDIRAAMAGAVTAIGVLGQAVAPLVRAFGVLARASVPYLVQVASLIRSVAVRFSGWINTADRSGKLSSFMASAVASLKDIAAIGKVSFKIVGQIIGIIFPASDKASKSIFEGVLRDLTRFSKWLENPKNQEQVRGWISMVMGIVTAIVTQIIPAVDRWIKKFEDAYEKIDRFVKRVEKLWKSVTSSTTNMSSAVSGAIGSIPGRISGALSRLTSSVGSAFSRAGNAAMDAVRSMAGRVVSAIGSIPGRAAAALGGLGGVLYSAGVALLAGLISGVRSQIGKLQSLLRSVTSMIPDWKGPLDTDRELLVPAGRAIMGGLQEGIASGVPDIRGQLRDLTGAIGAFRPPTATGHTTYNVNVTVPARDLAELRDVRDFFQRVQRISRQGGVAAYV